MGIYSSSCPESVSACSPRKSARLPNGEFRIYEPKTLVMIGAPISEGQDWEIGVDRAPGEVRKGGLEEVAADIGWTFEDWGDLEFDKDTSPEAASVLSNNIEAYYGLDEVKNGVLIGKACGRIYEEVKEAALENKFVLTVGGDHSLGCPTICGVMQARPELSVVWVDAHGDCNTPETSPSKNYHGMPAAHVMGWFERRVRGFDWMEAHLASPLPADRIAFVALRDVDAGEKKLLKKHGVLVFTMTDIDRLGISEVMERVLAAVDPEGMRPLHLSFDIDGIDPSVAPGTGTKARGGLTYRESHYICERLALTGRLGSMDMVEINPEVDRRVLANNPVVASPQSGQSQHSTEESPASEGGPMHGDNPKIRGTPTVKLGIELIESALGKTIL